MHFHFLSYLKIDKTDKNYNKISSSNVSKNLAISIGNFDGLHVGHQSLLKQLSIHAHSHNLLSAVMTFYPHPKKILALEKAHSEVNTFHVQHIVPQIDTMREKIQKILMYVDALYYVKFTQKLAQLSPIEFVENLYAMHVKYILVGADFRFAYKRQANIQNLIDLATPLGIQVEQFGLVDMYDNENMENNQKISSTNMRKALKKADFNIYEKYTQQSFFYTQKVCKGKQIGRTIGFPTLNLKVDAHFILPTGVYAVKIIFEDDINAIKYNAVASLGYRPTVELNNPNPILLLEVHILNWQGNAYGRRVKVIFLHKIRDEHHYINLETMRKVIQEDIQHAYAYF
jgi:riboflavin kinase / FMN adenylyltransferase